MKEKSRITKYLNDGLYCVLVPVYYDNETRPAWKKHFIGTPEECKKALQAAPDYLNATPAENNEMRYYRRLEYIQLLKHGKTAEAAAINKLYHFSEA